MNLEVKNVKSFSGMECPGFNASLYADGKKVALVIDEGNGGEILFQWSAKSPEERKSDEHKVNAYVDSLPGTPLSNDAEDWEKRLYPNGIVKQDLSEIVCGLVDAYENERRLNRLRKDHVLYVTPDCGPGEMYKIKHKGKPEAFRAAIIKKHPGATFL